MNTKTMRLPPRRVLTPSGSTNKRKERDDPFDNRPKPITSTAKLLKPDKSWAGSEPIMTATSKAQHQQQQQPSNQLLAGYLAHEFLTKGTLLGQPWAPPKEKSSSSSTEEEDGGEEGEPTASPPCRRTTEEMVRYAEVAGLLKGGGTHLTGVVNPTQLARFLHL